MNTLTLSNQTGDVDKAANYDVTLHNGLTATVRNLTVRDMLAEMTEAAKLEMESGDPRIEAHGRRWYLVGRALLGELDEPMDGYHEVLKTAGVAVGESREQFLARQLAEAQNTIKRLSMTKPASKPGVTDIDENGDIAGIEREKNN